MSPEPETRNSEDHPREDKRRNRELRIALPGVRPPVGTGLVGASALAGALTHGDIPADSPIVWPLVVLVLGSMAYDVATRAVKRRDRTRTD